MDSASSNGGSPTTKQDNRNMSVIQAAQYYLFSSQMWDVFSQLSTAFAVHVQRHLKTE